MTGSSQINVFRHKKSCRSLTISDKKKSAVVFEQFSDIKGLSYLNIFKHEMAVVFDQILDIKGLS